MENNINDINKKHEIIVLLLGKAGSGKGTQSSLLEEKYDLYHISTGDIIRENVKNNTKLGQEFKKYLDAGQLVPDELINNLVLDKVSQIKKSVEKKYNGFIFDGFPRTSTQLDFLANNILTKKSLNFIIDYNVSDEIAKKRIANRALTMGKNARKDDLNEQLIISRLEEYKKNHSDIICTYNNKYQKKFTFLKIDAASNKELIFNETCDCIDKYMNINDIINEFKKLKSSKEQIDDAINKLLKQQYNTITISNPKSIMLTTEYKNQNKNEQIQKTHQNEIFTQKIKKEKEEKLQSQTCSF